MVRKGRKEQSEYCVLRVLSSQDYLHFTKHTRDWNKMKEQDLRALFKVLETEYRNLKSRGAKTIDIDMILSDLRKHRQ